MSVVDLMTQEVTLLTQQEGAEDDMGNLSLSWTSTATTAGLLQQRPLPTEATSERDLSVSDWELFLPPDAVLTHVDRVMEGGREFEVVGTPYLARTPRGPSHYQVLVRLVVE